jgi:hypothetical protein
MYASAKTEKPTGTAARGKAKIAVTRAHIRMRFIKEISESGFTTGSS